MSKTKQALALKPRILIIRFSSIGDVLQCLSVAGRIKEEWPEAEIHWVTRSDLASLVETHPSVHRVWKLNRAEGFNGLWKLIQQLRQISWTHLYDAHNNLRSNLIYLALALKIFSSPLRLQRSLFRLKRFFLFKLRMNYFEKPFNGQKDLLRPLKKWGLSMEAPAAPQFFIPDSISLARFSLPKNYVALVPSAAFTLKRWPLSSFAKLIELQPQTQFVILGGPEDQNYIQPLDKYQNALNLTGKLSLLESAQAIQMSDVLIANDTGLLHMAEQLGKPAVALMGPAPFGFPSRSQTVILEKNLACRPCSKHGQGPCINKNYQACLTEISVTEVLDAMKYTQQLIKVNSLVSYPGSASGGGSGNTQGTPSGDL